MIKVNKPSFLATSEETQTGTKVELLTINYNSFLGSKLVNGENVPQGYIQSYLYTETMNSIMNDCSEDTSFEGNILSELHDMYIKKLELLNPSLTFEKTI
jgi:hypothetical protein